MSVYASSTADDDYAEPLPSDVSNENNVTEEDDALVRGGSDSDVLTTPSGATSVISDDADDDKHSCDRSNKSEEYEEDASGASGGTSAMAEIKAMKEEINHVPDVVVGREPVSIHIISREEKLESTDETILIKKNHIFETKKEIVNSSSSGNVPETIQGNEPNVEQLDPSALSDNGMKISRRQGKDTVIQEKEKALNTDDIDGPEVVVGTEPISNNDNIDVIHASSSISPPSLAGIAVAASIEERNNASTLLNDDERYERKLQNAGVGAIPYSLNNNRDSTNGRIQVFRRNESPMLLSSSSYYPSQQLESLRPLSPINGGPSNSEDTATVTDGGPMSTSESHDIEEASATMSTEPSPPSEQVERLPDNNNNHDNDPTSKDKNKKIKFCGRYGIMLMSCITIVLIILIVVVSVVTVRRLNNNNGSNNNSNNPNAQSSNNNIIEEEDPIMTILSSISPIETLQDSTSPQGQARLWIAKEEEEWLEALSSNNNTDHQSELKNESKTLEHLIERYILVVLFFATRGDIWHHGGNFLDHEWEACRWMKPRDDDNFKLNQTIQCNSDNRLTVLQLQNNNLQGTIPSEIGYLSELITLTLTNNKLTDKIPLEFGQLSSTLQYLALGNNTFTGTIPSFLNSSFSQLTYLSIWGNILTGTIPTSLGNLYNITFLELSSNLLTGTIPLELGKLRQLKDLRLHKNEIRGSIPNTFFKFSKLELLHLGGNSLSGTIPPFLGSLSQLEKLYLWENALTGSIPSELGMLSNMTDLQLARNRFTGRIPTELGRLNELRYLELFENNLTATIPEELTNATSLTELVLYQNKLRGSIPTRLGLLDLSYLGLNANQLTGTIPSELGEIWDLRILTIEDNNLRGTIPPSLGGLSPLNFKILYCNNLRLSGTIPSELGNLKALQSLRLHTNELTGTIPTSFSQLIKVTDLELYGNKLEGDAQFLCDLPLASTETHVVDTEKVQCSCCGNK